MGYMDTCSTCSTLSRLLTEALAALDTQKPVAIGDLRTVQAFLDTLTPEGEVGSAELHEAYSTLNPQAPLGIKRLGHILTALGYRKVRKSAGVYVLGISLR